MTEHREFSGVGELEDEIARRCPRCAEGGDPVPHRDRTGELLWFHAAEGGVDASCGAATLQKWRAIAKRNPGQLRLATRARAIEDDDSN